MMPPPSDEVVFLREHATRADLESDRLRAQLAARDELLQAVRRELVAAQARLLELQDLVTDRETKSAAAARLLPEAQAHLDAKLARITELTQVIGILEDKLRAAEARHAQSEAMLREAAEAHRRSLVEARTEVDRCTAEAEHLRAKAAAAEARAAAAVAERDEARVTAQQSVAAIEARAAAAQARAQELTGERDLAHQQAARLLSQIEELEKHLRGEREARIAAERARDEARARADAARQALHTVAHSLSWKVTRPLRALSGQADPTAPAG
jgi:DNA repair exonuclease SbcCD ATPase subunit